MAGSKKAIDLQLDIEKLRSARRRDRPVERTIERRQARLTRELINDGSEDRHPTDPEAT